MLTILHGFNYMIKYISIDRRAFEINAITIVFFTALKKWSATIQLITYLKGVVFPITVNLSGYDYNPGYQLQSYENYWFILLIVKYKLITTNIGNHYFEIVTNNTLGN